MSMSVGPGGGGPPLRPRPRWRVEVLGWEARAPAAYLGPPSGRDRAASRLWFQLSVWPSRKG
eukprot:SAG22_NODE_7263_length_757_cov_1.030395_1_plen_61_part_01